MFDVICVADLACGHCGNLSATQLNKEYGRVFCNPECEREFFAAEDTLDEREPVLTDKYRLVWSEADARCVVAAASSQASVQMAVSKKSQAKKEGKEGKKKTKKDKKAKKPKKAKDPQKPKKPQKVPPKATPAKQKTSPQKPPKPAKVQPKKAPPKPKAAPKKAPAPAAGGGSGLLPPAPVGPVPLIAPPDGSPIVVPPAGTPPPPAASLFGPDARAVWNPRRQDYDIYKPNRATNRWELIFPARTVASAKFSVRRVFSLYGHEPQELSVANVDWLLESEELGEFKRDLLQTARQVLCHLDERRRHSPERRRTGRDRSLYDIVMSRPDLIALRAFVVSSEALTQLLQAPEEKTTIFLPISAALSRSPRMDSATRTFVEDLVFALTYAGRQTRSTYFPKRWQRFPLRRLISSTKGNGRLESFYDGDDRSDFIGFELEYTAAERTGVLRFKVVVWDILGSNGVLHLIDSFPSLNR